MALKSKSDARARRHARLRKKVVGTEVRPRLVVNRSARHVFVQLVDDSKGHTLASASTLEKDLGLIGKNNVEAAAKIGAAIAERAKSAGVEKVVFDRGGFLFHGKVKALADAAREGGLKF